MDDQKAEGSPVVTFRVARPVGERQPPQGLTALGCGYAVPSESTKSVERDRRREAAERSRLWREQQRKKRNGGETNQQSAAGQDQTVLGALAGGGDLEAIARAVTAISVALQPLPAQDRLRAMDMVALMLGS